MYNTSNYGLVQISNLSNGFEISFPYTDNLNLTEFVAVYNSLSPYKAVQQLKRQSMLTNSQLNCKFWNGSSWENSGCTLQGLDKTHIKCSCTHLTSFAPSFVTPPVTNEEEQLPDRYVKATKEDEGSITLDDLLVPFDRYFKNLEELLQHKTPKPLEFIMKPGPYLVILFWFMYCTSLVYYTGKDKLRRFKMTKAQNRDDLAEMKDNRIQSLEEVIDDLIVKDYKSKLQLSEVGDEIKPMKPYCEMDSDEKKILKKRARRKVFGRVGSLSERAKRYYKRTLKHDTKSSETKMKFFQEALKTNFWFGLMARTSKIAPRHARLTLMYLYISIHLITMTVVYMFGYQIYVSDALQQDMFVIADTAVAPLIVAWFIGIPVALIFRMPYSVRKQIEGVKTKKVNIAFQELDKQMGCRYAFGYFICLSFYLFMILLVLFFNYFYPQEYCMQWLTVLIMMYILDLLVFSFAFAGLQLMNVLLSQKVSCFFKVWSFFEQIRYIKNLKG